MGWIPQWAQRSAAAAVGVVAVAALTPSTWGPSAGAAPRQEAGGEMEAAPASGLPGTPLTVRGTGCAGGIVTLRIDGQPTVYPAGDAEGNWSVALSFPGQAGAHEIDGECSDFTTVGAPTTFYGPGDLRFSYDRIEIVTEVPPLVDPTVTAAPTSPAGSPAAPPAATPTPAAPDYTG